MIVLTKLASNFQGSIDAIIKEKSSSWLDRNIICRIKNLIMIIIAPLMASIDLVIGILFGIANILTFRQIELLEEGAKEYLQGARLILCLPLLHLIKTINPNAVIGPETGKSIYWNRSDQKISFNQKSNGLLYDHFANRLRLRIKNIGRPRNGFSKHVSRSRNRFSRHVRARIAALLFIITAIVTRVLDLFTGAITLPLMLLTLGKVNSLNNLCLRSFTVTGLVRDSIIFTTQIINPVKS